MSVTLWIGTALVANVLIGAGLVAGVFKLMEQRIAVGAFGGIALGAVIIYAQASLGEQWFDPTVAEMKLLVMAAAIGAVLGVTGMVLLFEPEL